MKLSFALAKIVITAAKDVVKGQLRLRLKTTFRHGAMITKPHKTTLADVKAILDGYNKLGDVDGLMHSAIDMVRHRLLINSGLQQDAIKVMIGFLDEPRFKGTIAAFNIATEASLLSMPNTPLEKECVAKWAHSFRDYANVKPSSAVPLLMAVKIKIDTCKDKQHGRLLEKQVAFIFKNIGTALKAHGNPFGPTL
jgi:hypothetical protein